MCAQAHLSLRWETHVLSAIIDNCPAAEDTVASREVGGSGSIFSLQAGGGSIEDGEYCGPHLWDRDRVVSPALVNQAPCLTSPSSAVAALCCGWYSSSCRKRFFWRSGVSSDHAEKGG